LLHIFFPISVFKDVRQVKDGHEMKIASSATRAPMGSIVWGQDRPTGSLTTREKATLVRNMAYLQVREAVDAVRAGFGGLRPAAIDLDDLLPPENALVEDARSLAEETQEQSLLFHSWRTYLFGVLLAAHDNFPVDRSRYFAAAILHDTGLTPNHRPHLSNRCFALSGGERVEAYLRDKGHPDDARYVGDAIAMHLNAWVPRQRHGAEAHLVSRGATCDLFGAGRRRLPRDSVVQILRRFPRAGLIEGLQFETAHHARGTRPAVMTKVAGGKAPTDHFRALQAEADSD
jgi:hypothetical protein